MHLSTMCQMKRSSCPSAARTVDCKPAFGRCRRDRRPWGDRAGSGALFADGVVVRGPIAGQAYQRRLPPLPQRTALWPACHRRATPHRPERRDDVRLPSGGPIGGAQEWEWVAVIFTCACATCRWSVVVGGPAAAPYLARLLCRRAARISKATSARLRNWPRCSSLPVPPQADRSPHAATRSW
jgi:hypothetical protein